MGDAKGLERRQVTFSRRANFYCYYSSALGCHQFSELICSSSRQDSSIGPLLRITLEQKPVGDPPLSPVTLSWGETTPGGKTGDGVAIAEFVLW